MDGETETQEVEPQAKLPDINPGLTAVWPLPLRGRLGSGSPLHTCLLGVTQTSP